MNRIFGFFCGGPSLLTIGEGVLSVLAPDGKLKQASIIFDRETLNPDLLRREYVFL